MRCSCHQRSGTYVNQQWPENPDTLHGAWEFHASLIPNSPVKPLRIWMEFGDKDLLISQDGYHDWVVVNENMAKVPAAKGYHYQFVFAKNAAHVDRMVRRQMLPEALKYVCSGYLTGSPWSGCKIQNYADESPSDSIEEKPITR